MNTQLTEHKQHDDSDWKEKIVEDYYAEYYPNARTEKAIFKYLDELYYVSDDDVFFTIYKKDNDWFMKIDDIAKEIEKLFGLSLPDEIKIGDGYIQPARNPIPNRVIKNWTKHFQGKEKPIYPLNEHTQPGLSPELTYGDTILIVDVDRERESGETQYTTPGEQMRPEKFVPYTVVDKESNGSQSEWSWRYTLVPEGQVDEYVKSLNRGWGNYEGYEKLLYPWIYEWILANTPRANGVDRLTLSEHKESKINPELEVDDIIRVIEVEDGFLEEKRPETFDVYRVLGKGGGDVSGSEANYRRNYHLIKLPVSKEKRNPIYTMYVGDTWIYADAPPENKVDRKTISEHKESNLNPELMVGDEIMIVSTEGIHDFGTPELFKPYVVVGIKYSHQRELYNWTHGEEKKVNSEYGRKDYDEPFYQIEPIGMTDEERTGAMLAGGGRMKPMYIFHPEDGHSGSDQWILRKGFLRGEHLTEQEEPQDKEAIDTVQDIVDRVYPHIVNNLGKSMYVDETPKVELHRDIYERLSGIEGMEGEDSKTSKSEYESHVNTIYIYYPNMKNEKDVIQALLHEYTHSLQDPTKWAEHREEGYENNPYEQQSADAEDNWEDYLIYLQENISEQESDEHTHPGLNPDLEEGDIIRVIETDGEFPNMPDRFGMYKVYDILGRGGSQEPYYQLSGETSEVVEDSNFSTARLTNAKYLYRGDTWIYANTPSATKVDRLTLTEHKETNNKLINKYISEFWPQYRSPLYSKLYNTYHPSSYAESFNRPSGNFEDALELVADAVHEGKKLGLLDSSVHWSDIYNYESRDSAALHQNVDSEDFPHPGIDDDGIPTLNNKLEILDNTNLDWVHAILLFDVLEEIVDEFKHYCGENGIDESGMGKCMDEFPPAADPNTLTPSRGTLKQDYYTLFNFMRELERAGIPVADYLKDPTYPNIIKLVDDGTTDYNEVGGDRNSADWDNTRTQTEFEMDAPDRIDEHENYEETVEVDNDDTPFTKKEVVILKALHRNLSKEELQQITNDTPETYGSTGKKFWHIMKLFGIEDTHTEQNTRESKYAKWALDNWTEEGDYGNIENPIKAPLKWFDIERSETGSQIEYKSGNAEVLGFDEDDASERADYDFYAWGGEMETEDWGDYESYDSTIDSVDFLRMDESKKIVKVLREQYESGESEALQQAEKEDFHELMYEVLRRVRQIPLDKTVSPRRIKEILSEDGVEFNLNRGADLNENIHREYNRVRFYEYSQQLLQSSHSKGVRGHYFEGLLAGLFNGDVVSPLVGEMIDPKEDVLIGGINYSAKLVRQQDKKWGTSSLLGGFKEALIQRLVDRDIEVSDELLRKKLEIKNLNELIELFPEDDPDRDSFQIKHMELFLKDPSVDREYKQITLEHAFTSKSEEEIGIELHWIFGLIWGTSENFEGESLPTTNLKYYLIDTPSLIDGILDGDIHFTKGRNIREIRISEKSMIEANGATSHPIIFPTVTRQDLESLLYDEKSEEMVYKVMSIFKDFKPGTEKYMHHKIADVIVDNPQEFIKKLQDLFPDKNITEQTISRIIEDIDPELKYTIDQQYRTDPELRDEILQSLGGEEESGNYYEGAYHLNPEGDSPVLNISPIKIAQKFSDVNGYGQIKFDVQGGNGVAYFTDKDLVIKLTADESEYHTANKLVGTDNEYIVKVLESAKIKTSHASSPIFVIVEEALTMTKDMEEKWDQCCCGEESSIYIDYMKDPVLVLPPVGNYDMCLPIYDNIIGIQKNFAEYGIVWSDIGIDNLGIKNGKLAVIDLGETRGGIQDGKEMSLTLENIKVRPITKKHIKKQLSKIL